VRQIIALGGGGFSMEPDNLALDRYILAQAAKPLPSVCFLPTASGDAADYTVKFYTAFGSLDCRPYHLSLFRLPGPDLASFLLSQDVLYVGGGNTRSMLALWREWGLDRILQAAWEQGVVLSGLSAGALCWFQQGVTDSVPGTLGVLEGLGLLPGSFCPHYDGEPKRRPAYHRLLAGDQILPGYGVDDGVALHFLGRKLHAVVSSRPHARAYRLQPGPEGVREQALQPVCLEADGED
jgi:peptidase E